MLFYFFVSFYEITISPKSLKMIDWKMFVNSIQQKFWFQPSLIWSKANDKGR